MAYTKIKPIYKTISKAVKYITNPKKTSESLIYTYKTSVENVSRDFYFERKFFNSKLKIKARHLIVSFQESEIDSKKALELLKILCDKELKGNHQYILTIHTDTSNIHGHIIFNPVNLNTGKSYISNKRSYLRIKNYVDSLAKEFGLKIIEPKEKNNRYKNTMQKDGKDIRGRLKKDIDEAVLNSTNFDEFINFLESKDYDIKKGKYISLKNKFFGSRYIRLKDTTMGKMYSEDTIRKRIIDKNYYVEEDTPKKDNKFRIEDNEIAFSKITLSSAEKEDIKDDIGYIVDFENNIKSRKIYPYRKWAIKNNILTIERNLNTLYTKYGIIVNRSEEPKSILKINNEIEMLYNKRYNLIKQLRSIDRKKLTLIYKLKKDIKDLEFNLYELKQVRKNLQKEFKSRIYYGERR